MALAFSGADSYHLYRIQAAANVLRDGKSVVWVGMQPLVLPYIGLY